MITRCLLSAACLLLACVSLAGRTFEIYRHWTVDVPEDWVTADARAYPLDVFSAGPKATDKFAEFPLAVVKPNGNGVSQAASPEGRPGFSVGFSELELSIIAAPGESEPEQMTKILNGHKLPGWRKAGANKESPLILYVFIFPRCALPGVRDDDYSTVMLHVVGRTEAEADAYFKIFAGIKSRPEEDAPAAAPAAEPKPVFPDTDAKK